MTSDTAPGATFRPSVIRAIRTWGISITKNRVNGLPGSVTAVEHPLEPGGLHLGSLRQDHILLQEDHQRGLLMRLGKGDLIEAVFGLCAVGGSEKPKRAAILQMGTRMPESLCA